MGEMTNTFFDNLDTAATWSAGVAFKRSKALPLDKYSVFETKALAIEYAEKRGAYAETPVSYPGQVIAVAEGSKMVAYVLVEKADGSALELQQIGIIPTGDNKTIDVTEDGVISLLAADKEVFKKDADGKPTEEKEINEGAQLVLQKDGTLKWVKPDTTTVEGLSSAVEQLKTSKMDKFGEVIPLINDEGEHLGTEVSTNKLFRIVNNDSYISFNDDINIVGNERVSITSSGEAPVDITSQDGRITLSGNSIMVFDADGEGAGKITNLASPASDSDAANKAYVDTKMDKFGEVVKTDYHTNITSTTNAIDFSTPSGGNLFINSGMVGLTASDAPIRLTGNSVQVFSEDGEHEGKITNLAAPVNDSDAANKKYVDDELAKKVDTTTYDIKVKALEDEDDAIRAIAEDAQATINDFLTGTDTDGVVNKLKEIQAELEALTDAEELAGAISGKADKVTNATKGNFAGLDENGNLVDSGKKASDFATPADVKAVDDKFVNYTDNTALTALLAGKQDTIPAETYDAYGSAAQALADAKADTDTKLANYYTKSDVYTKEEIAGLDHATKIEVENAVAAEADRADKAEKANAAAIEAITKDATIKTLKGIEEALAGKQAIGDYATKTEAQGYANAKDQAIANAQAQADKGVADAKAAKEAADVAKEAADAAQADANTNALNIQEIEKELNGYGEGEQKVDGLITKVANNTARIATAEGTIAEHTTAIGNNATAAQNAQNKADEAYTLAGQKTTLKEAQDWVGEQDYATNTRVKGLEDRIKAEEDKVDNDTTYTFANGTNGTFTVTAKGGQAQTVETGAKAYVDDAIKNFITETDAKDYADTKVASVTARDVSVTIGGTATAPTVAAKISADANNALTLATDGLKVVIPAAAEYSIVKAEDSGDYAAIYNLTKDGAIVGASINIPKDMVVKSGSVVGDEIVLVLNDEANTEIKIPVGSLIEYVTSGSATGDMVVINVSDDHKVTATITDGTITIAKLDAETQTKIGHGESAYNTIANYGDVVTHDASEFATSAQGTKADNAAAAIATYGDIVTHNASEFAPVDINTGVMSVTSLHDAIVVENTNGAVTINFASEIILNGGGANA